MRKSLAVAALSVSLLLSSVAGSTAEAGRGGGGRSFSSGRSASFHSSGRSYSSSSSLSGKSYSSRPSSTKAVSPTRTSTKSYSSGSSPTNASLPPPRYSSGNPTLSGRSFGTSSTTIGRPSAGSFDAAAARSQRMAESKAVYQKGLQPKPTYTDRGGLQHPLPSGNREIEVLRRELDRQRWQNREWRQRTFFGRYYTYTPPVVVYHDPYSSFFWWWLLDRSLDEQAYWAYNHRQSMDAQRYHDLLAHNANLEARIHQLEAQHMPPDPTYRPDNIDPDLMYSNSYVDAVYNPQPRVSAPFRALLTVIILLCFLSLLIWLVFYKRWGGIGG